MINPDGIGGFIFTFALLIYWTMAFLVLYHLIRFGVSGQPKKIAAVFLAGSLVLTIVVVLLFSQVDFGTISVFNGGSLFNLK